MQKLFDKLNQGFRYRWAAGLAVAALVISVTAAPISSRLKVEKKSPSASAVNLNQAQVKANPAQAKAKISAAANGLPLAFEVNQGQSEPQIKYLARAKGYMAFLTADETLLRFKGSSGAMLAMKFQNANAAAKITGQDRQIGVSNYFIAGSKPITAVPHFGTVQYQGVYPGIDVAYKGNNQQLEYDFVVKPGADPSNIRVAFAGASKIALNKQGDLELTTEAGTTVNHKPVVYQERNGSRQAVKGDYVMLASNEVGVKLGAYDRTQPLIIDPTITVLAIIGGTLNDEAYGVAVSPATSSSTLSGAFITGRTQSPSIFNTVPPPNIPPFPVTPSTCTAQTVAGVTTCNANPTAATILQNAHSPNPPVNYDAFVTKLTQDGTTLVWSTYIGGTGDDAGRAIAVDGSGLVGGNVYVAGYTNPNNPVTGPLFANIPGAPAPVVGPQGTYDAFVVKLAPNGQSILASTFYGGAGIDQAYAIALDNAQGTTTPNVIVGGLTSGSVATTPNGFQTKFGNAGAAPVVGSTDGFVARLDTNLNLLNSTYVGGGGNDQVNGVAVDTSGNVYAVGNSTSAAGTATFKTANTPAGNVTAATGLTSAFIVKLTPDLKTETYGTIFGQGGSTGVSGYAPDTANGVAVDGAGRAWVVGSTGDASLVAPFTGMTIAGTGAGNNGSAANVVSVLGQSQGYLAIFGANPPLGSGTVGAMTLVSLTLQNPTNGPGATGPAVSPAVTLAPIPVIGGVSGPNVYNGGSWNAVAVDQSDTGYVVGQANLGPAAGLGSLEGQFVRFNPSGTVLLGPPGSNQLIAGSAGTETVLESVAVNPATDTTYTDGWTTSSTFTVNGGAVMPTGLKEFDITSPVPNTVITAAGGLVGVANPGPPVPNYSYPLTTASPAVGLPHALFLTITFGDITVSPNGLTFSTNLNTATGSQFITVVGPAGCAGTTGPTATLTGLGAGNFMVVNTSTGGGTTFTYQVTFTGTGNPGTTNANVVFGPNGGCAFENTAASVALSGTVNNAPINLIPQQPLSGLTEVQASGVIQPYFNTGVQTAPKTTVVVNVAVTTPTGAVTDLTPTIVNNSSLPTGCALVTTTPASGATPPNTLSTAAAGVFPLAVNVSGACAATLLPGTYTATIALTSPNGLVNPNCAALGAATADACLPFSLTVTPAVLTTAPVSIVFGNASSTQSPQATNIPINAPATGPGTFNFIVTYSPTSGTCPSLALPIATVNTPVTAPVCNFPFVGSALPASSVNIIFNASGSIPNGGSTSAVVQVNPVGLPNGVYSGEFLVSSCTVTSGTCTVASGSTPQTIVPITVYVGTGLGLVAPANVPPTTGSAPISGTGGFPVNGAYPLTINLPAGAPPAALPAGGAYTITVTGLDGTLAQPYVLKTPPTVTTAAGGTALPAGAVTPGALACPGAPAANTTYGSPTLAPLSGLGPTCSSTLAIDASLLAAGTNYAFNLVFTPASGPSTTALMVPITIKAQSTPNLFISQLNPLFFTAGIGGALAPLNGAINLMAPIGSVTPVCQTVFVASDGAPSGPVVGVGIPSFNNVWETVINANPAINGLVGAGPFGATAPTGVPVFGFAAGGANAVGVGQQSFQVCANPSAVPDNVPGTFPSTLTLVGAGLSAPISIPVNLIIGGGAGTGPGTYSQIGVFRTFAGTGFFALDKVASPLDYNYFDSGVAAATKGYFFGSPGDVPVAGQWTAGGAISIGVVRCPPAATPGICNWYIDLNNNGMWDGVAGGDAIWQFGVTGDQPVVGDWTGTGVSKIGVMRCIVAGVQCAWYLDVANQHTYVGSGVNATATYFFGLLGDKPAVGEWAGLVANGGSPVDQIGVFRCPATGVCTWIVDSFGANAFNAGDAQFQYGVAGDFPVVGNWYGNGSTTKKRIGVFRPSTGQWILNTNGTGVFTNSDSVTTFGQAGDQPVVGFWTLP